MTNNNTGKFVWFEYISKAQAPKAQGFFGELFGWGKKNVPMPGGDYTMIALGERTIGGYLEWQPAKVEPESAQAAGAFCWNELYSKDPAASVAFYSAIGGFTSKVQEMPGMGSYYMLESGGQPRAGILAPPMPQAPHAWLPYVAVANADASAERAKRLGATLHVPPTTIPGVGRFAIVADPQGASIGILQGQ